VGFPDLQNFLSHQELFETTSTEEMAGGAGKTIEYNRQIGKYTGYGSPDDE
jgi:hypothetical protein